MADTAACPTHPNEPVTGTCARCGAFFCALDSRIVDGKVYCHGCAARPDVDWLEGFKQKYWGRRDGWAWLFGISVPFQVLAAIGLALEAESRPLAPFTLLSAIAGALWWLKVRAARWLVLLPLLGSGAYLSITVHPAMIAAMFLPVLITLVVVTATRTKLFFEIEVGREEVRKLWDLYANNQVARHALAMGIAGLLIWPFAPLALLCGVVGFLRVDPEARPPIGRKGSAIAGVVLGCAGMIIATVAIMNGFR